MCDMACAPSISTGTWCLWASAIISFMRTLVFQIAAVMLMPLVWGIDGIWYSVVTAELLAVLVTMVFLTAKRKKYGY